MGNGGLGYQLRYFNAILALNLKNKSPAPLDFFMAFPGPLTIGVFQILFRAFFIYEVRSTQ